MWGLGGPVQQSGVQHIYASMWGLGGPVQQRPRTATCMPRGGGSGLLIEVSPSKGVSSWVPEGTPAKKFQVSFRTIFFQTWPPQTPLDRRGSSCSAGCTKNQPDTLIIKPLRGTTKKRPSLAPVGHRWLSLAPMGPD